MRYRDFSSLKVSAVLILLKMVICKKKRGGNKRTPVRKNPDSGYGLRPGGDNKGTSECQHGFVSLLNLPFQQVREPRHTEKVQ